jgi:biotin transporter BioY
MPALKQSPLQLIGVFRNPAHALPMAVASLFSAAAVLLTNLPLQLLAGNAWVADWSSLETGAQAGVLAAMLLVFALYVVLAASLIYALPLAFLRDDPLVPALRNSLRASRHFAVALSVLLGVLLTPFLLGGMVSLFSPWAGYLASFLISSVVFPVIAASLYCSYHDIFAAKNYQPRTEMRRATDRQTTSSVDAVTQ